MSRYGTAPGLKIAVRFEVPVDRDQAASKAAEPRAGLRDLGFNDGVGVIWQTSSEDSFGVPSSGEPGVNSDGLDW